MRLFAVLIVIGFIFFGCAPTVTPPPPQQPPQTTSQQNYQRNLPPPVTPVVSVEYTNDDDRRSTTRRGDQCGGDDDCEDICDDIFSSRSDREDCEDLSVSTVEEMEDFFEVLEDPDADDLEDFNLSVLEEIVDISFEPLVDEAKRYSSSDAKEFLSWMLNDEEAADIISDEDSDFEFLENILEQLNSDVVQALSTNIDGGDNFMEIAIDEGNEKLLEWVHDFFDEGSSSSSNRDCGGNSRCVFDKYCRMDIDSNAREDLLSDFDHFEDFMEDVLDDANENNIDVRDINDYGSKDNGNPNFCDGTKYRSQSTGVANNNNNNNNNNNYGSATGSCDFLDYYNTGTWISQTVGSSPFKKRRFTLATGETEYCLYGAASTCAASNSAPSDSDVKNLRKFSLSSGGKYKLTFKNNDKTSKIVGIIMSNIDTSNSNSISISNSKVIAYPVTINTSSNDSKISFNFKKATLDTVDDAAGKWLSVIYEKSNGKCGVL